MKITKIEITDFHQFKDLTIDLTYPKGHEKEGKPLDKVCFIGQSGTGKTTLLELIPYLIATYETPIIKKVGGRVLVNNVKMSVVFGSKNEYPVEISLQNSSNSPGQDNWVWSHQEISIGSSKDSKVYLYLKEQWKENDATKIINFPVNKNYKVGVEKEEEILNDTIIDFGKRSIWSVIQEVVKRYQEKELQIRQEISRTVEQEAKDNVEVIRKAVKKLENWKKTEFNPVQDIAENCLNPILEPFNLRVRTELDIQNKDDIGFIKIEDFDGKEISNALWSTGTKQLVLNTLPLYILKPRDTIILFDEPENSLYPDRQRFIINHYSSLTENCQCFYATHSPIIASEFEPWEIVELKFNDEGKVYRELYYTEGAENHVDNYVVDPRFLNYDLILSKVFDVQGVDTDSRMQAITELTMLKNQLEKLKAEDKLKSAQGKETFNRYLTLGKKLAWNKELADA